MSWFLIILAVLYLVFASVQDLKKREVANWLSFSLVIFALGFRGFYSVLNSNLWFLVYGLFGFGLFFILAHIFYYSRIFAGGDAKLLMGLGAVIGFADSFYSNFLYLIFFVILFMFVGSLYSLVWSLFLIFGNFEKFKKEFGKQVGLRKSWFYVAVVFALISLGLVYVELVFIYMSVLFILLPLVFCYAKAVEESCMIKLTWSKDITVGDWLYKKIRVGNRTIKPYWEGLDEKEVELIKKNKRKVLIKQGVPFVPSFLLSFLIYVWLWHSNWSFL